MPEHRQQPAVGVRFAVPGSGNALLVRERPAFILLLLGALYFAQGLPLGFIFAAYPVLLRIQGAELSLLAWVPLLGVPWILKFLWAPLVDNYWWSVLGRRRTWLVSQQALMITAMATLVMTTISRDSIVIHLLLLGLASLCAATQDVATDGVAAEHLRGRHLAQANAFSVGGMAVGTLVGGGGVLMATPAIGQQATLMLLVALLILCAIPALIWREEPIENTQAKPRATLRAAAARPHFGLLLVIAALYAVSHSADGALARLYLVDKGWSPAHIGALDAISMISMAALGCGTAAWLVARLGIWHSLIGGLLILLLSAAAWLAIAWSEQTPAFALAAFVRLSGSAGMGLAAVAVFTALMLFASGGTQAGTDVTIFKSANVFGEVGAASMATIFAAHTGYGGGFAFSALAGIAVLAIVLWHPKDSALDLGTSQPEKPTA